MSYQWNDKEPIYTQLINQICNMIMVGDLGVNKALPSIPQIATEYKINPATIRKAWQWMLEHGLITELDGKMMINNNAKADILRFQQTEFMDSEWPEVKIKIKKLDIDVDVITQSLQH